MSAMHTLTFIFRQCFCLIFLIAAECECGNIKKSNLPIPPNPTEQKKNSNPSITISEIGNQAVVCVGSTYIIHTGITGEDEDEKDQDNTTIKDGDNSTPATQGTITTEDKTINITKAHPKAIILVDSKKKISRQPIPQQKEEEAKKKKEEEEEEAKKKKEEEEEEEETKKKKEEEEEETKKKKKQKEEEAKKKKEIQEEITEKKQQIQEKENEIANMWFFNPLSYIKSNQLKALEEQLKALEEQLKKIQQAPSS